MAVVGKSPAGACPKCGEYRSVPIGSAGGRRRCCNCERVFEFSGGSL